MPSHFPVFVKSNNKNMGFKDMADVDFYVGFSKYNSNFSNSELNSDLCNYHSNSSDTVDGMNPAPL